MNGELGEGTGGSNGRDIVYISCTVAGKNRAWIMGPLCAWYDLATDCWVSWVRAGISAEGRLLLIKFMCIVDQCWDDWFGVRVYVEIHPHLHRCLLRVSRL